MPSGNIREITGWDRAKQRLKRSFPPPPEITTEDELILRMYNAWRQTQEWPEEQRLQFEDMGLRAGWLERLANDHVYFCRGRYDWEGFKAWIKHIVDEGGWT